jgi:hypothetical protein
VFNRKFWGALDAGNSRPQWCQPDSGTRDDPGRAPRITAERRHAERRGQADRRTSRLVEERPGHLDVAGHSDLRVALQRFTKQGLRFFAITWGGAIN